MRKITMGIIGFGGAGVNIHLPIINATGFYEVKAVNTTNPERMKFAKERGFTCYATPEELLEKSDVELVAVVTPHDTHMPLAVKALNAGKNVITDKLMCMNAKEADIMIEAAQKAGKMLTVFHNRRWDWDFLSAKAYLKDHDIGKIRLIKEHVYNPVDPSGWKWRSRREYGGGMMSDWGAHLMDHSLQLMEGHKVKKVLCQTQYACADPEVDVETWGCITLTYDNGTISQIETLNHAARDEKALEIFGDRYTLSVSGFDPQEEQVNKGSWVSGLHGDAPIVRDGKEEKSAPLVNGAWNEFYINVAKHLTEGEELIVKACEVKRLMQVLDAAFQSEREGRAVETDI